METVGPSYLRVERSIFQEPFQALLCGLLPCATQASARAINDARAHTLMPYRFMICLRIRKISGRSFGELFRRLIFDAIGVAVKDGDLLSGPMYLLSRNGLAD